MDKRKNLTSLKAKMNLKRTASDRFADHVNAAFGSILFFGCHVCFFAFWVVLNTGLLPGVKPFDPYPFSFLTMVVSLEAIFLSIFVLISQNRASEIADLREEVDLQLNVRAQREITRALIILDEIHDKLGMTAEDDLELKRMKKNINLDTIERKLLKEMKN